MTTTKDYRLESVRLDSFKDWSNLWIKPEELTAAGFYYTGESDKVKCFMCEIELIKWKPGDNPIVRHKLNSKRCDFINNISWEKVPIDMDPSTIPASSPEGVDECGIYCEEVLKIIANQHCEETADRINYWLKHLLYHTASIPKYPQYINYAVRLASYNRWPKIKSQAEKLATAGFYHSGNSDKIVTCYYCGGQLENLDLDDDPWIKHAEWFHHCLFLVLTKGTEFINNAIKTPCIKKKLPSVVDTDTVEEKFDFEKTDNGNIASGSSRNSINAEKGKPNLLNTEASDVSDEASNKE
ncbi:PREDICTED: baculoviral IAP repeat-containing protein 7-B-like [Acromyrmex echinatior]|uniref:Apoptosis inhibitor IAP n=2 Tax=Acromyrmex TaxID=64782 RepID=F4WQV7_ACREC